MYDSSGRSRRNLESNSAHPAAALSPLPSPLPSEGCSAPGTSLTRSGRYQPSVHGFILRTKNQNTRFSTNKNKVHAKLYQPCGGIKKIRQDAGPEKKEQERKTHLKSSISTSGIRCNKRIKGLVPFNRDPMMVSFLNRVRPSSGRASSRKL